MTAIDSPPPERQSVAIGDLLEVGDGRFLLIAGPCAVESRDQVLEIAMGVANAGAGMLRGGAFKPRTSPYSFQGLGLEALELLGEARQASGLPIVTEVLDVRDVPAVAEVADMLQVGARNMGNAALLREVARTGKPILLKRHFGASIDDLLQAAEYVLQEGNDQLLLCERGIRTFETATRYTLDLSAVPVIRRRSGLPVIVDPSHAAGDAVYVTALSRAAIAAGADGVLVEVHNEPSVALSDGQQSLALEHFPGFVEEIDTIIAAMGARRVTPAARIPA